MRIIGIALLAAGISVLSAVYRCFFSAYVQNKEDPEAAVFWKWELLRTDKGWIRSSVISGILNFLAGMLVWYFMKGSLLIVQIRWLVLLWALLLTAQIDIEKKLIPHHILWLLLAVRVLLFWPEWNMAGEYQMQILLASFIGGILGGGTMLLVYAISRGGLGFGDVKLFFLIGLYVGSSNMMEFMVYCFLGSALFGIALLVSRKAHMKDQVPLAPFAYLGAVLTCIFINL